MNPAKISISDCHLDTPVKKSSGKISFCLLPCLNNDQRLQVKLKTKFKIFAHQRSEASHVKDSFSLGVSLPEENIKFFKDLEKHLNSAAVAKRSEIKELSPSFARFQEGRGQVVFSIKHLFCGNVKAITCIVDEVLVEEMVQAASAFDEFEDRNEEDED